MKRKHPYFYINDVGILTPAVDNGDKRAKARKLIGNYFTSEEEARERQDEFYSLMGFKSNIFNRALFKKYTEN